MFGLGLLFVARFILILRKHCDFKLNEEAKYKKKNTLKSLYKGKTVHLHTYIYTN